MGLLKKKPNELDAIAAAAILPATDAAPAPAADGPADGAALDATPDGTEAPTSLPDAANEADEDEAEAPLDGGDALLSMFGSTQHESDDRAVILEMAGDIELADLMDEVQTVAAALNIATSRR
jgi:hypothetical protein